VDFTPRGVAVLGLEGVAVGETECVGELLQPFGGHDYNKL
jgi:hypothetical protein